MSWVMTSGKSARWINLLFPAKHGLRHFATKCHLQKMTKRNFETMIKLDKVVIFSKSNCCYSQSAKLLFDDIRTKYTAIELDRRADGALLQSHIGVVTGSMIMPKIFISGKCIGGYYELEDMHKSGCLLRMLKKD